MNRIFETWNAPLVNIAGTVISTGRLVSSVLILIIGFWLSSRVRYLLLHRITPHFKIHQNTGYALAAVVYYIGVTITLILALACLGFNVSNFALLAGALSIGIGLGLQNIANNFISGLLMLFDSTIKVGDYVELANRLRGKISQIRIRSTIILTNDGVEVIVPNSQFLSDRVINWTLSDDARRMHIPFGVAYGSDVDRVMQSVQEKTRQFPYVILDDKKREPHVWFTEMGESSLNFELIVWVRKPATQRPRRTLSEFLRLVHQTLMENGFEIPFPQRDLHLRSVPSSLRIRESEQPK